MASMVSNRFLQEALQLATEARSAALQDLVSNNNAVLAALRERNAITMASGPLITERLVYAESNTFQWYKGFEVLNAQPRELINAAEFTPTQAQVAITLSGGDIVSNQGQNQLMDIMQTHIEAGEREIQDRVTEGIHSDGTATNQLGGLQLAIPTVTNTGVYGGIDRATYPIWRTSAYDANSDFPGFTTVDSASVRHMYEAIMINHTRGRDAPSLILASQQHYSAFSSATVAIQRITNESSSYGKLGFASLVFEGGGHRADVVLEAGIGSSMPADTTYFIQPESLKLRYYEGRYFQPFNGSQVPPNQDAVVQRIGFMGQLTMCNPRFNAKLYDSAP